MTFTGQPKPPTLLVVGAFAAIYLVWGSTYLVVRYAIETIPPFLMFGSRSFVAGILLFLLARWQGAPAPTASQWRAAFLIGFLLIALASSLVAWAEKKVPSSVAALIVSGLPFWMVLFDRRNGRPTMLMLVGLVIGFTGVTVLVLNGKDYDNKPLEFLPVAACLFATLAWATGSLLNRDVDTPDSPIMTVAAQMIAGGLLTLLIALGIGEGSEFSFGAVTTRSFTAWCYLLVMG
ncbi:MAG: EamA family transporter [Limisphaerales bacterium]